MDDLLDRLSKCVELGKIDQSCPFPREMKGEVGADELCRQALESGIDPDTVLKEGLVSAMTRVGEKYSRGDIFIPEMLLAARAMIAAMKHLKPYIASGAVRRKGVFVVGTVMGDLHDIGKNIVAMAVEGAGWEVIDLGSDVKPPQWLAAVSGHPGCVVGMSALLTTTMVNMEAIVREIKQNHPGTTVLVGGAPLSAEFCRKIGADFYSPNPQGAVQFLDQLAS